ncbi:MAG: hypothetical protein HXS41_13900 [Theionarchaea archaeon]|nr:hypothetical protein [Theionarchaea archaeon]MBU7022143.1 hypothetical protein [Theionarchaea archaeon]MBU7035372.1 hypothetical protein [Theionarchaea archaeon]MBU7040188.1 hypothetical protein [Theionarchaea archaeon]
MKTRGMVLGLVLVMTLVIFCSPQNGVPSFAEYGANPVFSPGRAYYPTVIYDLQHFSDVYAHGIPYYKMWYSSSSGIDMAYSGDGMIWYQYGPVSGLVSAHHAHVVYDPNGFGGTSIQYKMWFWDTSASIYTLSALKHAQSSDGVNWSVSPLSQDATSPLVTGVHPDWNRGTYGPVDVFYNPGGSSVPEDSDIWKNKYVMYYDCTTGGTEQVGLAYSADGLHWKRYGNLPVLPITAGAWDSSYAGFGSVIPCTDGFHFFYSGGQSSMHEGIGYAFSLDGITWEKAPDPLFHISDGDSWRSVRCYTPSVLARVRGTYTCFCMWFSGDDGGSRAIGYAEGCLALREERGTPFRNTEREIQQQMTSLAQYNYTECCQRNQEIARELLDRLEGILEPTPEYKEALALLEEGHGCCLQSTAMISSGNAVAGNYFAIRSCQLYSQALGILQELEKNLGEIPD